MVPPETPALPAFRKHCSHSLENEGVGFASLLYFKKKNGDMKKVCLLLFA